MIVRKGKSISIIMRCKISKLNVLFQMLFPLRSLRLYLLGMIIQIEYEGIVEMDFIYFYSTKTRMENLVKRELLTLDINIDKNI